MRIFDISSDKLMDHQRLRIVKGVLYVEDKKVRKKVCWLCRLFTRSQYNLQSQLRYLQSMEPSLVGLEKKAAFLDSLAQLILRARHQNIKYQKDSNFVRWVKGKKFIPLYSALKMKGALSAALAFKPEPPINNPNPPVNNPNPPVNNPNPPINNPNPPVNNPNPPVNNPNPPVNNPNPPVNTHKPQVLRHSTPLSTPQPIKGKFESDWNDFQAEALFMNWLESVKEQRKSLKAQGLAVTDLNELEKTSIHDYFTHLKQRISANQEAREELLGVVEACEGDLEALNDIEPKLHELNQEGTLLGEIFEQDNIISKKLIAYHSDEIEEMHEDFSQKIAASSKKIDTLKERQLKLNEWEKFKKDAQKAAESSRDTLSFSNFKILLLSLPALIMRGDLLEQSGYIPAEELVPVQTSLKNLQAEMKGKLPDMKTQNPSLAGEIDQLLNPDAEVSLEMALKVMKEAREKAIAMRVNKHAGILQSIIKLEEKQKEVLEKLAKEKIETLIQNANWAKPIKKLRYKNYQEVGAYLQKYTECPCGSLVFHTEDILPDSFIKILPNLYYKAYKKAEKANNLTQFFQDVFPGGYACIEGNTQTLIEWETAHPDKIETAQPGEVDLDLVPDYNPNDADKYVAIGAFLATYREKKFREFFKTKTNRPFDKTQPLDNHLRDCFLDEVKIGKKPELTKDAALESSFYEHKLAEVTQEKFAKFMLEKSNSAPGKEILYKKGKLTPNNTQTEVDDFWSICM